MPATRAARRCTAGRCTSRQHATVPEVLCCAVLQIEKRLEAWMESQIKQEGEKK
jgi:hypothetical protein